MELAHVPDRLLAKIAVTATLAIAAAITLTAMPPGRRLYFVDELIGARLWSRDGQIMRLHGFVKAGSINQLNGGDYRFTLARNGVELRVIVHGPLPDRFRDQSDAIVLGRLHANHDAWVLEASEVMTRCPTKYDGEPRRLR